MRWTLGVIAAIALLALLQVLRREIPPLAFIAGHEDLDTSTVAAADDPARSVARKRDPGPLFPWQRVLDASGLERLPASGDGSHGL